MSKSIPVNPEYSWDTEPQLQPDYFNPVVVNNKVIFYSNEIIKATDNLTGITQEVAAIKFNLRQWRSRKEDIEEEIITGEEWSKEESKNLTVLMANVRMRVRDTDYAEEYFDLVRKIRDGEEKLEILTVRVDNGYRILDALKLVCQNIQTALSFYKAEMKSMR